MTDSPTFSHENGHGGPPVTDRTELEGGQGEYTFGTKPGGADSGKARAVVFDGDRRVVHFRNRHVPGRFFAVRALPHETFGYDEILAVYRGTTKSGVGVLEVVTTRGKARITGYNDAGLTFDEVAQRLCALAPNDRRSPAEEHPIMPLLYTVGGLAGLVLFLALLGELCRVVGVRGLPVGPVGTAGLVVTGLAGIVSGVAGVFWTTRLAHRWLGIKIALPLGLGVAGALGGLILVFSPVAVLIGFAAGLVTGAVMERRKSAAATEP